MPFYFPTPALEGATARNPASGVTYTYRDEFSAWVIEGSSGGGSGTPNVISENEPAPIDEFPSGSIWYKPSTQQLYIQNNGKWEVCAPSVLDLASLDTRVDVNETILNNEIAHRISGDEALRVKVQDTAPADPIPNLSLWFDSTDLELLLYYNDGDSSQWVPCSIPLSQSPDFHALKADVVKLQPLTEVTTEIQEKMQAGEKRIASLESNPLPDVNKNYVDEADVALLNEIQGLKDRVRELEKSNGTGSWRLLLEGQANQGEMMIYQQGFAGGATKWEDVGVIGFDLTDLSGRAHKMDGVAVDDVIRLNSGYDSQATFQITEVETSGIYQVKLQSSKGKPIDQQEYKIDVLSSFDPSKLATLSFVTQQLETFSKRLSKLER